MGILRFQRDYRVELIPGYLILLQNKSFLYKLELRIWDTDSLMEFMMEHYSHLGRLHPPPVLSEPITLDASFFCHNFRLSAHTSPLRDGLYTIWMLAEGSSSDLMHKYYISIPEPRKPSLHRKGSHICTLQDDRFDEQSRISYAGHIHIYTHDPRWICKITSLAEHLSDIKEVSPKIMRLGLNKRRVSKIQYITSHVLNYSFRRNWRRVSSNCLTPSNFIAMGNSPYTCLRIVEL
jgi:hypothetical protein